MQNTLTLTSWSNGKSGYLENTPTLIEGTMGKQNTSSDTSTVYGVKSRS